MTLRTRRIPALDREVSALGFGCMGISWAYLSPDEIDDQAGVDILATALEQGVTFFDTSDAYGAGHNEQIVGRGITTDRDAVVATKAGLVGSFQDGKHVLARDGRPEHLRAACDASLQRLGRDVIDLYYLHRVDLEVPLEESWGALSELVTAGKVRALGLSEVSVAQADVAHAVHPVAAIQSELSLWTRDALGAGATADGDAVGDVVGWTRDHDAIFVPFSPLGRGFLTGALDPKQLGDGDFRKRQARFSGEAGDANQAIVDVVRAVADDKGVTPGAVALAWVLAQGEHVIPIPGTTKAKHLADNLSALSVELTPADLDALAKAPAAVGARY